MNCANGIQRQSKPFIQYLLYFAALPTWSLTFTLNHNFWLYILANYSMYVIHPTPRSPPLLWGQHLRPMRRAHWIGLHHRGLHRSRISAQLRSHSARCASMLWRQQWLAMNLKWMSCQPVRFSPSEITIGRSNRKERARKSERGTEKNEGTTRINKVFLV